MPAPKNAPYKLRQHAQVKWAPLTPIAQAQLTIQQNRLRPGAQRKARQEARKAQESE